LRLSRINKGRLQLSAMTGGGLSSGNQHMEAMLATVQRLADEGARALAICFLQCAPRCTVS
jgi:hypothetical protein